MGHAKRGRGHLDDAQGTGLSTFSGGVFQTVATDTGQKLSEGSYIVSGRDRSRSPAPR